MEYFGKITIIILNYNGYNDTIECLNSIWYLKYDFANIILIDNASIDHSVEKIIEWSSGKFSVSTYSDSEINNNPQVFCADFLRNKDNCNINELSIIKNSENVGFAAGCNQGIDLALSVGAEYIWLLNNDTVVEPDSLTILAEYLDGHVKCQVATPQIRLFDEPDRIWNCGGLLKWYGVRKYLYVHRPVSDLPDKDVLDITFVTGCAPLVRSTVFKRIGKFTENFFFGEEDFDFSLRMNKAQGKMVCCLRSVIYHKVGATLDDGSGEYNIGKAYIHYLNRFINMRYHWPRLIWQIWRMIYVAYIYRLLGRRAQSTPRVRIAFINKLLYDSSRLHGVNKELFQTILQENSGYFLAS